MDLLLWSLEENVDQGLTSIASGTKDSVGSHCVGWYETVSYGEFALNDNESMEAALPVTTFYVVGPTKIGVPERILLKMRCVPRTL